MKLVFSTVVEEFNSLEEVAAACMDCVEQNYLYENEGRSGVPEDWQNPDIWTKETILNFLTYNGGYFYNDMVGFDEEESFNDNIIETRITIEA